LANKLQLNNLLEIKMVISLFSLCFEGVYIFFSPKKNFTDLNGDEAVLRLNEKIKQMEETIAEYKLKDLELQSEIKIACQVYDKEEYNRLKTRSKQLKTASNQVSKFIYAINQQLVNLKQMELLSGIVDVNKTNDNYGINRVTQEEMDGLMDKTQDINETVSDFINSQELANIVQSTF
jgi:hypothetical protein